MHANWRNYLTHLVIFGIQPFCLHINNVPRHGILHFSGLTYIYVPAADGVVVVVLAVVSVIISDRNIAGSSVEGLVEEEDVSVVFSFVFGSG
mgnify:CR=1 FL=1